MHVVRAEAAPRTEQRRWLLHCVRELWAGFRQRFVELWDAHSAKGDACCAALFNQDSKVVSRVLNRVNLHRSRLVQAQWHASVAVLCVVHACQVTSTVILCDAAQPQLIQATFLSHEAPQRWQRCMSAALALRCRRHAAHPHRSPPQTPASSAGHRSAGGGAAAVPV